MIVVDPSAIVAILKDEPDSRRMSDTIGGNDSVMSGPSVLEAKMVLSKMLDDVAVDRLIGSLVATGGLRIIDFTPEMGNAAVTAFRLYGKGRGHPAGLNFGDCMAYAVAKVLDVPLLYKGGDFARTDIRSALA